MTFDKICEFYDKSFYTFDETFYYLFTRKRYEIGDYLSTNDNNHHNKLFQNIIRVKNNCNSNAKQFIFNLEPPYNQKYGFFELPTHELINCIINICKHYGVKSINEVGAGNGLLSYVINKKYNLISKPSDPRVTEYDCIIDKYCQYGQVECKSFKDIDTNEPILISWLNSMYENEFIEMIENNKPKFIIHVGTINGSCYSKNLVKKLEKNGYYRFIIPAKQISKEERFFSNFERASFITLFTKQCEFDIKKICLEENLDKSYDNKNCIPSDNFTIKNYFHKMLTNKTVGMELLEKEMGKRREMCAER